MLRSRSFQPSAFWAHTGPHRRRIRVSHYYINKSCAMRQLTVQHLELKTSSAVPRRPPIGARQGAGVNPHFSRGFTRVTTRPLYQPRSFAGVKRIGMVYAASYSARVNWIPFMPSLYRSA
jgi:hypothetical protein